MTAIQTDHGVSARTFDGIYARDVAAGYTLPSLKGDVLAEMPRVLSSPGGEHPIAYMDQVHGSDVKIVEGPGRYTCDGIFTRARGLALVVRTADCLPLVFASKAERAVGVVHMGWRSAEAGILEHIGFDLASFTCVAGVGMRPCCYEVGEEFAGKSRIGTFVSGRGSSYVFDPVAFARHQLLRQGLAESNFFDTKVCSYCSSELFHSHRRTGTTDRTLSFIAAR